MDWPILELLFNIIILSCLIAILIVIWMIITFEDFFVKETENDTEV